MRGGDICLLHVMPSTRGTAVEWKCSGWRVRILHEEEQALEYGHGGKERQCGMRQSLCHLCAGLLTGARQACFHQVILQRKFPLSLLVFECKASSFPCITVQGLRGAQPVFLPHNASCMRVLPVALVIPFPSRLFTAEICAIACAMSPCWLSCSTAVCRANRHRGSAAEGRGRLWVQPGMALAEQHLQ